MKIASKYLTAGMELSEDIPELNLKENFILTEDIVAILKKNNIDYIDIKVSSEFDTFSQPIKNLIKNVLNSGDVNELHDLAVFLTEIISNAKELKFDTSIYLSQDYSHIVNTIIITSLLTKKYNEISESTLQVDLESSIYASILEDVGRRAKNKETLKFLKENYSDDLKEFRKLVPNLKLSLFSTYDSKYHPIYSYFFCKYYKTSENVKMAVLLHHEKESGESSLLNTPLDSKENEEYARIARIIKLADLFDIIYRNNVLKKKDNPFEGIGRQLDAIVASNFVNAKLTNILKTIIPIYQVGMKVLLSDGTVGIISKNDSNDYNNPTVVDLNGDYINLREESLQVIKQVN